LPWVPPPRTPASARPTAKSVGTDHACRGGSIRRSFHRPLFADLELPLVTLGCRTTCGSILIRPPVRHSSSRINPTYALKSSRATLAAFASSLDQIAYGPHVADSALCGLGPSQRTDPRDSTSFKAERARLSCGLCGEDVRGGLGVPKIFRRRLYP